MSKLVRRDVGPVIQKVREFLLGRPHTNALRWEDGIAARTQPQPVIPDGVSHKLSANYYLGRDPRREVGHPNELTNQKMIADGAKRTKLPTPGKFYNWSEHSY